MSLRSLAGPLVKPAQTLMEWASLPPQAKQAWRQDKGGLPAEDPGIERSVAAAVSWLRLAQSMSASQDGGVARHFSLIDGWSASYPETTGYIVPTLFDHAVRENDADALDSARRMLDWLVGIQFAEGGFQGGRIDSNPVVPVTFNTGQILLGLAAGVRHLSDNYLEPMQRAADWLVRTQDPDGCWRKHPTPFAAAGEKAYEMHVAWGLFEADRVDPTKGYGDAGIRNVEWALQWQRENGWIDRCCLTEPSQPLTHTLGYALRGILEAYRLRHDERLLSAARRTADGIMTASTDDGFLPGRLRSDWRGAVTWACLTGSVQVAHCWLLLGEITGEQRYLEAGFAANRYVRRTVSVDGPDEIRGAVKGSFPVNGEYGRFEFLNWAPKFFVDSNLLERKLREESAGAGERR